MITHTPPKYHCDESRHNEASGCKTLRETLWRVRPSLAICGHVHEGRGAERILWDLDCPNVKFKESATGYWTDPGLGPGNRKQSHLDLSAKSAAQLNSTRSWVDASDGIKCDGPAETFGNRLPSWKSTNSLAWTSATSRAATSISEAYSEGTESPMPDTLFTLAQNQEDAPKARTSESLTSESGGSQSEASSEDNRASGSREFLQVDEDRGSGPAYVNPRSGIHTAARGQGGSPPSGRCDLEALAGRKSRKETCVVNAAIMASSWPYKVKNDRKYNKPIIIDIDLPLW